MTLQNWLLATALFLSGANLLGLVFPVSIVIFVSFLLLTFMRPVRISRLQMLAAGCAWSTAVFGFLHASEYSDISANVRQMVVVAVALLLVGILRNGVEDVLEKYFIIFTIVTVVGLIFYTLVPNFYFLTHSLGTRSYLIGPSSMLLDSGVSAFAAIGPYRFQGLFEEPATYSVFSAAAMFWAYQRKHLLSFFILFIATVLSEGVVGAMVLMALFLWHLMLGISKKVRFVLLALGLSSFVLISPFVSEQISEITSLVGFMENKTISTQVRVGQFQELMKSLTSLVLPSGFSNSEVLKVTAESITSSYLRSLIPFGLIMWAITILIIFVGLMRTDIYRSSGILFLALAVSGTSRMGIFDLFIGWFLLFCVLEKNTRLITQRLKPVSSDAINSGIYTTDVA